MVKTARNASRNFSCTNLICSSACMKTWHLAHWGGQISQAWRNSLAIELNTRLILHNDKMSRFSVTRFDAAMRMHRGSQSPDNQITWTWRSLNKMAHNAFLHMSINICTKGFFWHNAFQTGKRQSLHRYCTRRMISRWLRSVGPNVSSEARMALQIKHQHARGLQEVRIKQIQHTRNPVSDTSNLRKRYQYRPRQLSSIVLSANWFFWAHNQSKISCVARVWQTVSGQSQSCHCWLTGVATIVRPYSDLFVSTSLRMFSRHRSRSVFRPILIALFVASNFRVSRTISGHFRTNLLPLASRCCDQFRVSNGDCWHSDRSKHYIEGFDNGLICCLQLIRRLGVTCCQHLVEFVVELSREILRSGNQKLLGNFSNSMEGARFQMQILIACIIW